MFSKESVPQKGREMIIFIFIDLNELQKKGRNYAWTRPKKCFVCGRFQVWGHGFVDCLFDGIETALPCKRLGAEPKGEKEGGQGEVWAEMEDPVFRKDADMRRHDLSMDPGI